jgi:hypothetical protein
MKRKRLLANNDADLAICQARNRSVGNEMEWRALGSIEMDFYASSAVCGQRFPCRCSISPGAAGRHACGV